LLLRANNACRSVDRWGEHAGALTESPERSLYATAGFGSVSWEPRLIVTLTVIARAFGPVFYRLRADRSEARRGERSAGSDAMAKKPGCVPPVADNARGSTGLDAATRTAVDAGFSPTREAMAWGQREPRPQHCKQNEPTRAVLEVSDRQQFRIQYLGGPIGQGPEILKEVAVRAPNVFAAFRAADHGAWPPGAAGFRLLDSGGEEVFWRRRPEKDISEPLSGPASRA
jgi:hypothetical protein